jgi:hypothetical protein
MSTKKRSKTESAVITFHFKGGETFSESAVDHFMHSLREMCRMWNEPSFRPEAEARLREVAKVLAERSVRDHLRQHSIAADRSAVLAELAKPEYAGMRPTKRDLIIARKCGVSSSLVRELRPKLPRGRPKKAIDRADKT